MTQREGRLVYGPGEWYALHGMLLREGDPLDILVGKKWVACHVHYEASDGHWYCDAGIMSIPLSDGREARFRLELVCYKQSDEDDLMLAALGDLGELYVEDDWDEEFEEEER
jgi:Domain of unknown function (DUF5348)